MNFKGIGTFTISALLTFSVSAAQQKSICGQDDRVPSTNPKIGRLLENISAGGGCTVTMISKTCAISAGHCSGTFGIAEFNTPASIGGRIQHPEAKDIYPVLKDQSKWVYSGIGSDWAVLKIGANTETGLYAGDVQGFYEYDFSTPKVGTMVRITGYGLDRNDPTRNLAKQTHNGEVTRVRGSAMYHVADTMGGNSGSTIIRESDDKIVAIHTNGGCSSRGGANSATTLANKKELQDAILACLATE